MTALSLYFYDESMDPQIPNTPPDLTPPLPLPPENGQKQEISATKLNKRSGKFLLMIFVVLFILAIIPAGAIIIVKSSKPAPPQATSTQPASSCNAVYIADSLNNPLSQNQLQGLRPGDEVKIIISASGQTVEKARFRINGSTWQEVLAKVNDNFIGNYIIEAGIKKFTVESEVFDKDKGWL